MNVSINTVVKSHLRSEFSKWYSNQLAETLSKDCEECVDLSTARMESIGARWLVNLYEHLENSPDVIVNGFRHADIHQALNLLTDIDDSNLVNYSESSSEDSTSDIEENEVDNEDPSLLVSDVYQLSRTV